MCLGKAVSTLPQYICTTADPGFYMVNWLWIGKCHLALGKKEEAQQWLKKTVSYNATLEEELEVFLKLCFL